MSQDKEGGLESVLRVVGIVQHRTADGEDHRPMAPQQGLKGRRVAPAGESFQQRPIRRFAVSGTVEEAAQVVQHSAERHVGHDPNLSEGRLLAP
jgi:hypothetical protein